MSRNLKSLDSTLASTPADTESPQAQSELTRIRLKTDAPLSELNGVFPDGIPVELTDGEPTFQVNGVDCHVVVNAATPDESIAQIIELVMRDEVPYALQLCLSLNHLVAIPAEWVEA